MQCLKTLPKERKDLEDFPLMPSDFKRYPKHGPRRGKTATASHVSLPACLDSAHRINAAGSGTGVSSSPPHASGRLIDSQSCTALLKNVRIPILGSEKAGGAGLTNGEVPGNLAVLT
jgi:hypothetical protein